MWKTILSNYSPSNHPSHIACAPPDGNKPPPAILGAISVLHGWHWVFFGPPIPLPAKNCTQSCGHRNFMAMGAGPLWDPMFPWCYNPTLFFLPPLIHPSYSRNNPSHLPLHGYITTIPIGPNHVSPPSHYRHYRLSYRPTPLPIYPDPDSAPNTLTHQASLIRSPWTLILPDPRASDSTYLRHVSLTSCSSPITFHPHTILRPVTCFTLRTQTQL